MRKFLQSAAILLVLVSPLSGLAQAKEEKPLDLRLRPLKQEVHVPLSEKADTLLQAKQPLPRRKRGIDFMPGGSWNSGSTEYQLGFTPRRVVVEIRH